MIDELSPVHAALIAAVPFARDEVFRLVLLRQQASGVDAALSAAHPRATIVARQAALDRLDWWDAMFGADLVVVDGGLGDVNDARTQYLYKAAADRVSARGALLVAGALQPGHLLRHLVWLRHAGFAAVDCYWRIERLAVFGGVKAPRAEASAPPLRADN
jgi:hypothetical protein